MVVRPAWSVAQRREPVTVITQPRTRTIERCVSSSGLAPPDSADETGCVAVPAGLYWVAGAPCSW